MDLKEHFYVDKKIEPRNRIVEMLHSGTPTSVKEHVMRQFSNDFGHLRILIATIAYGMGVNCLAVTRIIHFGPSKSIQAYIQESGRCGRKGETSVALLLYNGLTFRLADTNMKEYVKSENDCRRKMLMKHFDTALPSNVPSGHNCCDVCTESCKCLGDSCDQDLHLPCDNESLLNETSRNPRQVSDGQRENLICKLKRYQKKLVMKYSSLTQNKTIILPPTIFLEFGKMQIRQVIEHAEMLFTLDDILSNIDIWKRRHGVAILQILGEVFNDVELPMECGEEEEDVDDIEGEVDEWDEILNDPSFLELLGQTEWEEDSFTFLDLEDSIVEAI